MRGTISPFPHTSSWRGASLTTRTTLPLPYHKSSWSRLASRTWEFLPSLSISCFHSVRVCKCIRKIPNPDFLLW